jgi:hypothetical protein
MTWLMRPTRATSGIGASNLAERRRVEVFGPMGQPARNDRMRNLSSAEAEVGDLAWMTRTL